LRNETSKSEEDKEESHEEEIDILRAPLPIEGDYFFLDKGRDFCYPFLLYS